LKRTLTHPVRGGQLLTWLQQLKLSEDVDTLFHMLDEDNDGVLSMEEFVLGCLRLQGEPKAIDVAKMAQSLKRVELLVANSHGPGFDGRGKAPSRHAGSQASVATVLSSHGASKMRTSSAALEQCRTKIPNTELRIGG